MSLIDVSYVDPVDHDARADALADARADALDDERAAREEAAYERAEREGKRLDSALCSECPDLGLCAAEGECPFGRDAA